MTDLLTSEPAFPDSDERNGESTGPDHDDDDDGLTHEAEVPPPIPAEQENLDEDELLDQALGGSGGEEEQEDIQDDAENNLGNLAASIHTSFMLTLEQRFSITAKSLVCLAVIIMFSRIFGWLIFCTMWLFWHT